MSNLPFELFIAVRYLLARRKQAFISLISLISILGVGVGVTALLIVIALMTGLQGELRDRLVGAAAHVFVQKTGGLGPLAEEVTKLRTIPRVVGAAPAVLGLGLARTAGDDEFITIKGIEPSLETSVTNIGQAMQRGRLDALAPAPGQMPGIVLGKELAQKLGVSIDDTVVVVTPEGPLTPLGISPQTRPFRVVGIFSLGLFEYDSSYGLVHLSVAQKLFDKARPDFIELRIDDMFRAEEVAALIPSRLGSDYLAQDWAHMNKSLFSALWLEKMGMAIAIGLIVMVAALNIIASLVLLVMEKTRDIAILKTMGSSSVSIRRIFMFQGLIIGLVGTVAGAALGCTLIYVLDRYKLISVSLEVYQISHVPFRLQTGDFLVVVAAAVAVCFLATIYPSRQAAKLDPAQALRYQ
jgi:lipoprotein-releasing system permease protein